MSCTITFTADSPRALREDIITFLNIGAATPEAAGDAEKRGRAKKRTEEVPPPVAPVEDTAAAAAKVAARVAAVSTEASGTIVPPAETAPATAIEKPVVQKALIAIVQKFGKDKCAELCQKYGAGNLSAIEAKHWPALLTDAQNLLSAG